MGGNHRRHEMENRLRYEEKKNTNVWQLKKKHTNLLSHCWWKSKSIFVHSRVQSDDCQWWEMKTNWMTVSMTDTHLLRQNVSELFGFLRRAETFHGNNLQRRRKPLREKSFHDFLIISSMIYLKKGKYQKSLTFLALHQIFILKPSVKSLKRVENSLSTLSLISKSTFNW